MKRPTNNNDDFSFDFGGDELFPLDAMDGGEKAPKGVKGYFKNVVKSVKNLTIKTTKHLYPEVFELGEKIKPGDTGESINVKQTIEGYKEKAKHYAHEGKNIAKDIANDVKTAVKTGYFVKSEEEDNSIDDMFGDMFGSDLGGGSGDFDFGSDGDDFNIGQEEGTEQPKKKASMSTKQVVVKASMASTRAHMKMGSKQISATMGAAQAQIKHESRMFGQQFIIEQEHHHQKMLALKNIASNIGKIVKQNNASIKAQMEFSAKSLAFSQDLAAMTKEIRNAQWTLTKPKEIEKTQNNSMFNKIFGPMGKSFNIGAFVKNYISSAKSGVAGGALDGLSSMKETLSMFTDMGMSTTNAIKMIFGPMILESAIDKITSQDMSRSKDAFNRRVSGLPGALNRKLGKLADEGLSEEFRNKIRNIPGLGKIFTKFEKDIQDQIQEHAGYAHIDNGITQNTTRFAMGDPNAIHPFDNIAHKVLTEVIPKRLASIDAGINHREETYFDFKTNSFKKVSSVSERIDREVKATTEGADGYYELKELFGMQSIDLLQDNNFRKLLESNIDTEALLSTDIGKNGKELDKNFPKMVHNLLIIGRDFGTIFKELSYELLNDNTYGSIGGAILNGTSFNNEIDRKVALHIFSQTIKKMKDSPRGSEDYEAYVKLQIASDSYSNNMSQTYSELEESFGKYGSSILYDNKTKYSEIDKLIEHEEKLLKSKSERIDKYTKEGGIEKVGIDKLKKQRLEHIKNIKELRQQKFGRTDELTNVGLGNYSNFNVDSNEDQYTLMSLKDNTTHGLVNNIYQLLLDGIGVYNIDGDRLQNALNNNAIRKKNRDIFIDTKKEEKKAQEKEQFKEIYGIYDSMKNKDGKVIVTIYYEDEDSEMVPISGNVEKFINEHKEYTYYAKSAEIEAIEKKYYRKQSSLFGGAETLGDSLIGKIPGVKLFSKAFNTVNKTASDIGSSILGKYLYGEDINDNNNNALKYIKDKTIAATSGKFSGMGKKADELATYVTEKDKFKNKMSDFAKKLGVPIGNSRLESITIGRKSLKQALKESNDIDLITSVQNAKDPLEKAQLLLASQNTYIAPYLGKIRDFEADLLAVKNGKSPSSFIMKSVKEIFVNRTKGGALRALVKIKGKVLDTELKRMKVNNVKLEETLAKINDPALMSMLNNAKDPVEKAKILLNASEHTTDLVPFKAKLQEFIEIGSAGDPDSIKSMTEGFFKAFAMKKVNKVLDKVSTFVKNKVLTKEFENIKVGDEKLVDVIAKIGQADPAFIEELNNAKDPVEKAHIILRRDEPEIQKFKPLLKKFEDNNQTVTDMVLNKAMSAGSMALNWLKKRIFGEKRDTENLVKSINKDIRKAFGNDEVLLNVLDKAGIDSSELKVLGNDAVKQAEYMMENGGKAMKPYKRVLKKVIKAAELKRETRKEYRQLTDQMNAEIAAIDTDDEFAKGFIENDIRAKYNKKQDKLMSKRDKKLGKWGLRTHTDNDINSVEEQRKAKADAAKQKEEEKRTGFLATIASTLTAFKKDGMDLSKKTTKDIEEANEKGAAQGAIEGGSGVTGMLQNLLSKTGLDKTKTGAQISQAISMAGGAFDTAKSLLGKGGAVSTGVTAGKKILGRVLGKVPGVGKALTGAVGGAAKGAVGAGKAAVGAGKFAVGAGKVGFGATKGIGKLLAFPLKLLKGFLTNPKVSAMLGRSAVANILKNFAKGVAKAGARITGKLMSITGLSATGVGMAIPIATAVAGFIKGIANAKKYFTVGKGMKLSWTMKLASGVAMGIDGLLFGIPSTISGIMGYKSLPYMVYGWIGDDMEKEALSRYRKYNEKRAIIYGIMSPDALVAYETRHKGRRGVRAAMSFMTLGLVKNNDEKDSADLGFVATSIYRYWKEFKYKPLDEIYNNIAQKYGGLDIVEEMITPEGGADVDKDDDGRVDQSEEGQKYLDRVKKQQDFRVEFLKEARKYVLEHKLAWLNTNCSLEEFEKYSGGIKAEKDKTFGEKAKSLAKKAALVAVAGPVGLAVGLAVKNRAKVFNSHIKEITGKDFSEHHGIKAKVNAVLTVAGALIKRSKDRNDVKRMKGKVSMNISILENIWAKVTKDKSLAKFDMSRTVIAMKRLTSALKKYCDDNHEFAEKLNNKFMSMQTKMMTMAPEMAKIFNEETNNITNNIGIELDQKMITPLIRVTSGMIGTLKKIVPELEEACSSMLKKSMKLVIFEIIVKGVNNGDKILNTFEKYRSKRADILGIKMDSMEVFEERINEQAGLLSSAWTSITNWWSGGEDKKNAAVLGFDSVEVYKFWKAKRYDPVKELEKNIARKYGLYSDLIDPNTKNIDAQKKFIDEFLKAAAKYVNDAGIAWLTYRITAKDFAERRKNGNLVDKKTSFEASADAARKEEQKKQFSWWDRLWGKDKAAKENLAATFTGDLSSVVTKNYNIDTSKEDEEITKSLYEAYGYNKNKTAETAMENASSAIKDIWKGITPASTEETPKAKSSDKSIVINPDMDKPDTERAGGEPIGIDSIYSSVQNASKVLSDNLKSTVLLKGRKAKNKIERFVDKSGKTMPTYDTSGKTPKALVMQSIVSDFTTKFGKEVIEKLDMLQSIHTEQLRHNKVSEEFFTAAISMMAMIAKGSGNTKVSSELDNLMRRIVK